MLRLLLGMILGGMMIVGVYRIQTAIVNANSAGVQGYLDVADCRGICGWATNSSRSDQLAIVDIYVDGMLVDTLKANLSRSDLEDLKIGDHAFSGHLPSRYYDGRDHLVQAKEYCSGVELNTSPKIFNCSQ